MKLKHFIILFIILILSSLIYFRIYSNQAKEAKNNSVSSKKAPISVNAQIVHTQEFKDNLSLNGSLEANEQIEIRSEVSGIIDGIYFQEGGFVNQGQILLKVSDLELKAQLAQAQTKVNLAVENERRAKLLIQKEAISQEEYDLSNAELQMAKSQIQLINAQIARTVILAPFSGKIGFRNISKGAYITPNTLIAKLVNTSQLKIAFSIPEKYVSQIKINSNIEFSVAGSKDKFTAKIYAIEPSIELETRTLQVKAITNNTSNKLMPGIFAEIDLPLDVIKDAFIVPTEAIIPIQNGKKVFIAQNGNAKEVKIETATRTDASILVISGLKNGDTLITSGVMALKDKMPIKLKMTEK